MQTILIIAFIVIIITIIWVISIYLKTINYNNNQNNFIIGSIYKSTRPYIVLLIILGIIGLILGYLSFIGNIKDPVSITYDEEGKIIIKDERCEDKQHRENDKCINNARSIQIENGSGEEHWLGTQWSNGIIMGCNKGYITLDGMCIEIDALPSDIKEKLSNIYTADLPNNCERGNVDRIVDGDTIVVDNNTIRLVGIDTPESVDPNKPIEPYSIEASNKIKDLILGRKVCLSADDQSNNTDKYNRLLRYVYLEDGTFINAKLIEEGYARAYTQFPFHFFIWFTDLEKAAKNKNIGLWSE